MSSAREQLKRVAGEAGYPPGLLCQIAHATLPHYVEGERLAESQIAQVTDAVATLAQARLSADQVNDLIAEHQLRHNEHWRQTLWTEVLTEAGAHEHATHRLAA